MGDPKLSRDEQKVYDRWRKVCEHNFKNLNSSVQFSCVVQKKQLEQDARLKQQAMQQAAIGAGLQRKMEAMMYVSQTVDARQAEATADKQAMKVLADNNVALPIDPLPNILLWSKRIVGNISDHPVYSMFWNMETWGLK